MQWKSSSWHQPDQTDTRKKECINRNGSRFSRRNVEPQQVKMVGWKHFCVGTQQWDEDAMQWIKKQALAYQGHVLKYDKTL